MRYFLDSEFSEGAVIELISLAIVAEDGRELYVQSSEFTPQLASDWVKEHVFPHLTLCPHQDEQSLASDLVNHYVYGQCTFTDPATGIAGAQTDCLWRTCEQIALEIRAFCDPEKYGEPEFWGWCAGYDFVVLCQVFGTMMDLPAGFPHYIRELQYLLDKYQIKDEQLPAQSENAHNALADAHYLKLLYGSLMIMPFWKPTQAIRESITGRDETIPPVSEHSFLWQVDQQVRDRFFAFSEQHAESWSQRYVESRDLKYQDFVGRWHNGELIEKGDPRLDEQGNLRSTSPDEEITPEVIERIGGYVDRLGLVTTGGDGGHADELVIDLSEEQETKQVWYARETKDTLAVSAAYFEHLLACLANQKFIHDVNADGVASGEDSVKAKQREIQGAIDEAYRYGHDLLQKHCVVRDALPKEREHVSPIVNPVANSEHI